MVLASTIGLNVALNKKMLAGSEILRFIRRGELLSVARLHGVAAEVVEVVASPGSRVTREPLSKLRSLFGGKMTIGGVRRNGHWEIGLGETRIGPGERLIVVCHPRSLKDLPGLRRALFAFKGAVSVVGITQLETTMKAPELGGRQPFEG